MKKKVLLVGESWISSSTHFKGFDQFGSVTFHVGAEPLQKALAESDYDLTFMPAHIAVEQFPFDLIGMQAYDAIIISDIGANSFLLPPQVWLHSKAVPNRLKLLKQYVEAGGALIMAGGYLSFQGIDGRARWRRTPVEDTLPVTCLAYDDRIEIPEGAVPEIVAPNHPIVADIDGPWPYILGVNEVELRDRDDIELIASLPEDQGGHPLLVAGAFGKGRTVAWTSDISPHWLPQDFCNWQGYTTLWRNILKWSIN